MMRPRSSYAANSCLLTLIPLLPIRTTLAIQSKTIPRILRSWPYLFPVLSDSSATGKVSRSAPRKSVTKARFASVFHGLGVVPDEPPTLPLPQNGGLDGDLGGESSSEVRVGWRQSDRVASGAPLPLVYPEDKTEQRWQKSNSPFRTHEIGTVSFSPDDHFPRT